MSVLLQNVAWWPLLFLGLVPLLLHLYARARPTPFPFSSVEFVQKILKQTRSLRKPRDRLLLFLRTLMILALVGVFLKPLLFSDGRFRRGDQKHLVLLVDASASMGYADGTQSRFSRACTEAADMLNGLRQGDHANLFWIRRTPESVYPEPSPNLDYLRKQLRQATLTWERGDPRPALQAAIDQLRRLEGTREICVISDFQSSTWDVNGVEMPEDITLVLIPVGDPAPENFAVAWQTVDPALPLSGEPVQLLCEIANYSGKPAQRVVTVETEGQRLNQAVDLLPWSKRSVVFDLAFDGAGERIVKTRLEADRFPGDDERWSILPVRESLSVGTIGQGKTLDAWKRATTAIGRTSVQPVDRKSLAAWREHDLILIEGPAQIEGALWRAYLKGGGRIVWLPSRDLALKEIDDTLEGKLTWDARDVPVALELSQPDAPLFKIFQDGEYGDPTRTQVMQRYRFDWPEARAEEALMRYVDGTPALLQMGNLLLWNIPLDPEASDFASYPEFLVLIGEVLFGARQGETSIRYEPGDRLHLDVGALSLTDGNSPVLVQSDAQHELASRAVLDGRQGNQTMRFESPPVKKPGAWQWKEFSEAREVLQVDCVNLAEEESDLRCEQTPEAASIKAALVPSGRRARELSSGRSLWPWLLGLAIFCFAIIAWLEQPRKAAT